MGVHSIRGSGLFPGPNLPHRPSNLEAPIPDSTTITRRAKSNLAFAFSLVAKERRRDLTTFYAFCRVVDDVADDPHLPTDEKRAYFAAWRKALHTRSPDFGSLEQEIYDLRDRHALPPDHFLELLAGCESDLHPQRFASWEELRHYCSRVASAGID